MNILEMMRNYPRANDGGGGAGDGGQGGGDKGGQGGGDGGQGGGDKGGQGGGDAGAWKAPAGLPDHLVGKDANETLTKLLPAFTGLRTELGERGAVPKDWKDYNFAFSDTAKPLLNIKDDDKVLPIVKGAMHKFGITDKQAGFVPALIDGFIEAGIVPKPEDPNVMWKNMAPAGFKGSDIEAIAAGQTAMREGQAYVDSFKGREGWDAEMIEDMTLLTATPAGLRIIKQMQKGGIQKGPDTGGKGDGKGVDKAALDARRQDPRNQHGNAKYDPAFAQETERMYKQLYPE